MNTLVFKAFLFALITLALTACGGTIDSNLLSVSEDGNNNIYRSYTVSHSEDVGRAEVSATFSVSNAWGTTVRLVAPSSITVNGIPMKEHSDQADGGEVAAFYAGFIYPPAWFLMSTGTHYTAKVSPTQKFSFRWVDQTGREYSDSTTLPYASLLAPAFLYRSSGLVLNFSGYAFDSASVRLSQEGKNSKYISTSTGELRISPEDLKDFDAGKIRMDVEVKKVTSLRAEGSAGGSLSATYKFTTRTLEAY